MFVAAPHSLLRKPLDFLRRDAMDRNDQLANAKAEIKKIERDLESLKGERQGRQNLEALVASLREQPAIAQGQLMAVPRPTESLSYEARNG